MSRRYAARSLPNAGMGACNAPRFYRVNRDLARGERSRNKQLHARLEVTRRCRSSKSYSDSRLGPSFTSGQVSGHRAARPTSGRVHFRMKTCGLGDFEIPGDASWRFSAFRTSDLAKCSSSSTYRQSSCYSSEARRIRRIRVTDCSGASGFSFSSFARAMKSA